MRHLILAGSLIVLSACANPAQQQLQAACEDGNLSACQTIEQNRIAAAIALQQMGANMSASAAPAPRAAPVTCVRQGVFLNCY